MAIFASLVHGLDLNLWGAFGFSHESVRNKLASEMRTGDYILSIATSDEPTAPEIQGRLLALMRVGRQQVLTQDYVDPDHWADVVQQYGGVRWPYGMPIIEAEVFDPMPLKNVVLPRIRDENLHRKLANNYERLTAEEQAAVLALPRIQVADIYRAQSFDFQQALLPRRPGPAPSAATRKYVPKEGPTATYLMALIGDHARHLVKRSDHLIFKVGFSRDPQVRLKALNCFYPKPSILRWHIVCEQWHTDAVNAYAMEQHALCLVHERAVHLVGEIYEGRLSDAESAFAKAKRDAVRPEKEEIPAESIDLMF